MLEMNIETIKARGFIHELDGVFEYRQGQIWIELRETGAKGFYCALISNRGCKRRVIDIENIKQLDALMWQEENTSVL